MHVNLLFNRDLDHNVQTMCKLNLESISRFYENSNVLTFRDFYLVATNKSIVTIERVFAPRLEYIRIDLVGNTSKYEQVMYYKSIYEEW